MHEHHIVEAQYNFACSQTSSSNGLRVTIPSDYMAQGSTYAFVLRVETAFGGFSEAEVEVHKSSTVLLNTKVSNPILRRIARATRVDIISKHIFVEDNMLGCGDPAMEQTKERVGQPERGSINRTPSIIPQTKSSVYHPG